MYIHNLSPVAFKILNFQVYWYSLAYLFGFLISIFFSHYLIKKKLIKLDSGIIDDLITYAILGVVIGGRLGYILFYNLNFYLNNPVEIVKIWNGGMSFHGGLLGLIISTYLVSNKQTKSFIELLNLVACCGPIGIFLGRLANFVNGELVGKPTNSSWGVLFHPEDVLRHPSQLYEAFFEGFLIFFFYIIF